ncbi:MAG TPA: alpha-ribazole-5-phosphate synthase, partial [Clostridiaceae bacterium]|nr:alpha-ribazole-5-phosphate synthase [Clostridiaceae bacterium]
AAVISVGLPKVGNEVISAKGSEIVDYKTIYKMLKNDLIYEIVPVGSKGIAYEAAQLARNNGLILNLESKQNIDIKRSGGPSTSVIAAIDFQCIDDILDTVPEVNVIGYLKKN